MVLQEGEGRRGGRERGKEGRKERKEGRADVIKRKEVIEGKKEGCY